MHHQFIIKPDWQPIETAPKDRPIVLATLTVDFNTGKSRVSYPSVFWGRMIDFPNEECWVSTFNPSNGSAGYEQPFRHVVYEVEEYGQKRSMEYYRGEKILGWAEPWEYNVIISPPPHDPVYFEITDKHC